MYYCCRLLLNNGNFCRKLKGYQTQCPWKTFFFHSSFISNIFFLLSAELKKLLLIVCKFLKWTSISLVSNSNTFCLLSPELCKIATQLNWDKIMMIVIWFLTYLLAKNLQIDFDPSNQGVGHTFFSSGYNNNTITIRIWRPIHRFNHLA